VFVIDSVERPTTQQGQTVPPFDAASIKALKPSDESFPYGGCRGADLPDTRGGLNAAAGLPFPQTPLGRCIFHQITLKRLVGQAYGIDVTKVDQRIFGGSRWIDTEKYHLEAIAPNPSKVTSAELTLMLQQLLADRFKLLFHRENRDVLGYALVVAGTPKLERASGDGSVFQARRMGDLRVRNRDMTVLADSLALHLGRPVIDETKLEGRFSFTLTWTPSDDLLAKRPSRSSNCMGHRSQRPISLYRAARAVGPSIRCEKSADINHRHRSRGDAGSKLI
jgi:uncharacterized protein (TIGR03435 family)